MEHITPSFFFVRRPQNLKDTVAGSVCNPSADLDICGRKVVGEDPIGRNPRDFLVFTQFESSSVDLRAKHDEKEASCAILVFYGPEMPRGHDLEPELFVDFPHGAGLGRLAGLDFSPGKLPFTGQFAISPTSAQKVETVLPDNGGRDRSVFHVKQCSEGSP